MSKEITLALDSSGPNLLVAVSDGQKTYSARQSGIKQEQFFLSVIERLLTKIGAELSDIKQICFVRGPGRFTGLRISLTFASMMQMLNGSSVYSATLFELLYQQVQQSVSFAKWKQMHPDGIAAVVLHAFREEYFLQFFDADSSAPQWLSKTELLTKLSERKEPLYIAGTDKDGESLVALLSQDYRLAPLADSRVRPQTILQLAQNPIYQKNALEPLYLKPARFELGK